MGDIGNKGIIRVGITQQGAYRQQYLGNGERRRPLLFQDIQANASVSVDIGMINLSLEVHLGRQRGSNLLGVGVQADRD